MDKILFGDKKRCLCSICFIAVENLLILSSLIAPFFRFLVRMHDMYYSDNLGVPSHNYFNPVDMILDCLIFVFDQIFKYKYVNVLFANICSSDSSNVCCVGKTHFIRNIKFC